jgi:hypothetical protein
VSTADEIRKARDSTLTTFPSAITGSASNGALLAIFSAAMEIAAQLAEINHHLSHGDYALEVRNVEP